ncbi:MAG: nucleotidyltransferase domain-containing protein [Thermoguttaceae bacterium]|jgi:predicted nucleotidyltransferase
MVAMREIQRLGRTIGREFHPRQVILFGSYARGAATKDSDVDLLVVMAFAGKAAKKSVEIRTKVRPRFPVDLVVRTPTAVRRRVAMGDCFMREILSSGRVLYEADHR